MSAVIYRLTVPLVFPAGLSPGEGKQGNRLVVARDGQGRFVLRGTALAGALRHAWARARGTRSADAEVADRFGDAYDDDTGRPSPLSVADVLLNTGRSPVAQVRTHVARDRHTGSVLDGGLFDLEALPPGTSGTAVFVLRTTSSDEEARRFLSELVGLIEAGLTLGGNAARGLGRTALQGTATCRSFALAQVQEHAAWLDEQHAWRGGRVPSSGEPLVGDLPAGTGVLTIRFTLATPRGQDFVVGDGQGLDHDIEPQRVVDVQGDTLWRLPGSTIRGALRSWVSRLAAREGLPVADSLERHRDEPGARGDRRAWGFTGEGERRGVMEDLDGDPDCLEERVPCPVMRLFGSSFSAGRVHVTDAFCARRDASAQVRKHVAIDRFSGGANEGFLFDGQVLHGGRFEVSLTVWEPDEIEARWLATGLRAIDMGLCRIGSSKAGGRLALAGTPSARGPHAELFNSLEPIGG